MSGVLDLLALAVHLREALVVGALEHNLEHLLTEEVGQLFFGRLCVLDRVVEDARAECVDVFDARGRENLEDFQRMVDVRAVAALPSLGAVLHGRERAGPGQFDESGGHYFFEIYKFGGLKRKTKCIFG